MSMFGVEGKLSTEVKTAIDRLQSSSEVTAHMFYIGAPPEMQATLSSRQDTAQLVQLKGTADRFYEQARSHEWKRL